MCQMYLNGCLFTNVSSEMTIFDLYSVCIYSIWDYFDAFIALFLFWCSVYFLMYGFGPFFKCISNVLRLRFCMYFFTFVVVFVGYFCWLRYSVRAGLKSQPVSVSWTSMYDHFVKSLTHWGFVTHILVNCVIISKGYGMVSIQRQTITCTLITQLIWITWTLLSAVWERPLNLITPSPHYLNYWWLTVNWHPGKILQWFVYQDLNIFI